MVQELSSNVVVVEKLTSFQHKDKNMRDHGENVRHRAKQLSELIMDPDRVRAERKKVRGSYVSGPQPAPGDETENLGLTKLRELSSMRRNISFGTPGRHASGPWQGTELIQACSDCCIVGGQSALHLTNPPRLWGRKEVPQARCPSHVHRDHVTAKSDALCSGTHPMQCDPMLRRSNLDSTRRNLAWLPDM